MSLTSRNLVRVHNKAVHMRCQLHTSVILPNVKLLPLLQSGNDVDWEECWLERVDNL